MGANRWGNAGEYHVQHLSNAQSAMIARFGREMGRAAPRSLGRRVRRGGENRAREARAWPCTAIYPF